MSSTQLDKKIKQCVTKYFRRPCSLYIDISENLAELLLGDTWKFEDVIKTRTIQKVLRDSDSRIKTFKKFNKIDINTKNMSEDFVNIIKKVYSDSMDKKSEGLEAEKFEFKDCELSLNSSGHDCLVPKTTFDVFSYYTNLVVDEDANYYFNKKINEVKCVSNDNIYKIKLKVEAEVGQAVVPVYFRGQCHKKDKYGALCGNEIIVGHHQQSSSVKCNIMTNNCEDKYAHSVNVSKLEPINKNYYIYLCTFIDDKGNEIEYTYYSLTKIADTKIIANCVTCNFGATTNGSSKTLIIAYVRSDEDLVTLDSKLLIQNNSRTYLHDIFKSIKNYYKKYHKVDMNLKNRYIAFLLINILINNRYHQFVQNAAIFGSSGSGKSYFANLIPPMFTDKVGYYNGDTISRVGFIGGQDIVGNTRIFRNGAISKDVISILEESARPLDKYHAETGIRGFNIYESIKTLNPDKAIDIGIQGSKPVKWNSSLIFIGNMAGLASTKNYLQLVRREFKKLSSGRKFNNATPPFCNLGFYKKKDEALAQAHKIVRDDYLADVNYMTRLPIAEQSRFDFMMYLIPDNKEAELIMPTLSRNLILHRANFIKELDNIFGEAERPSENLNKEVHEFLSKEYRKEDNNYNLIDTTQHVYNKVFYNALYHVWNNRVYMGKEPNGKLNDEDKALIREWLRYNYNSLNTEEASFTKRPAFNTSNVVEEDTETLKDLSSKKASEYYEEKRKEEFNSGLMSEDSIFMEDKRE